MRLGKELIGKPIYSISDGRHLGGVKDLYMDQACETLMGLYLGSEGLFSRKANIILIENVMVLGVDAVLVNESDVITDSNERPEVSGWLRREELQGRNVDTPGGTKVGTVGDILLDEKAHISGFTLARVFVEGPLAESRRVSKQAVVDVGATDEVMTLDLAKAELPATEALAEATMEIEDESAADEAVAIAQEEMEAIEPPVETEDPSDT